MKDILVDIVFAILLIASMWLFADMTDATKDGDTEEWLRDWDM